eukprot:234744_1
MSEVDTDNLVVLLRFETQFMDLKFRFTLKVQNAGNEQELLKLRVQYLEDENMVMHHSVGNMNSNILAITESTEKRQQETDQLIVALRDELALVKQAFKSLELIELRGSTLITESHLAGFKKMLPNGAGSQFSLIFKASRDGFSSLDFHTRCDGQCPTLVVAKAVDSDIIFGGYAAVPWHSNGAYIQDPQKRCFLFRIDGDLAVKFSVIKPENTIYGGAGYGPTFGAGHDLYISNNANQNEGSYSAGTG